MFKKLIKYIASNQILFANREGYKSAKEEILKEREKIKYFELEQLIGKKVITINNEWEDMVIGIVTSTTRIAKTNHLVLSINDCFTGLEYFSSGPVYKFDIETLNALLKLTPYERWNLRVPHAPVVWGKPFSKIITPPAKFRENLKTVGYI